eukprot:UN05435
MDPTFMKMFYKDIQDMGITKHDLYHKQYRSPKMAGRPVYSDEIAFNEYGQVILRRDYYGPPPPRSRGPPRGPPRRPRGPPRSPRRYY